MYGLPGRFVITTFCVVVVFFVVVVAVSQSVYLFLVFLPTGPNGER